MHLDRTATPEFKDDIELRNFPFDVTEFRTREDGLVSISFAVPDRDRGTTFILHRNLIGKTADDIYCELQDMVLHELAEAWHRNGVREYDPHAEQCGVQPDGTHLCRFDAREEGHNHMPGYEDDRNLIPGYGT